ASSRLSTPIATQSIRSRIVTTVGGGRQRDGKARRGERRAGGALRPGGARGVPAPGAHQLARDRQAEAGPARAAPSGPPAVEAAEHVVLLARREAGTVVEDLDR